MKFKYSLATAVTLALLQGCGGGGGDSSSPTPSTSSANGPTWKVYDFSQPSKTFINQCETPRVGLDPYDNYAAYPDKLGSALHEKLFLRAFTNETYLWYDEVPDNNPANYKTVTDYFNTLVTSATTATGKPKDRFHFTVPYEDDMKSSQSGLVAGFGFNWAFLRGVQPRDVRISYTEEASPADRSGIARGDKLLKINNIDVVNTGSQSDIDFINKTLFNPDINQDYTFTFESVGGLEKTVTLTASDVMTSPVKNAKVITQNGMRIGYLQYNSFEPSAQAPLIEAFSTLSAENVDEIVVDLRYNGGGLVLQSSQVGYMLSGAGQNRVFSELIHNDKVMRTIKDGDNIYRFTNLAIDWAAQKYSDQVLPTLNKKRVYVLTSGGTASSSELLINALRGIDVEVIQIGSTTTGKPYGFSPEQNCGTMYYTIQFKSANEKKFGDFADGFIPTPKSQINTELGLDNRVEGCWVNDDLTKPLGDPSEGMLSAALNYMETGTCPPVSPSSFNAMPRNISSPELSDLRSSLRTEAIHVEIN
ncbi:peptidase S41 [Vibrio alginolyticus]